MANSNYTSGYTSEQSTYNSELRGRNGQDQFVSASHYEGGHNNNYFAPQYTNTQLERPSTSQYTSGNQTYNYLSSQHTTGQPQHGTTEYTSNNQNHNTVPSAQYTNVDRTWPAENGSYLSTQSVSSSTNTDFSSQGQTPMDRWRAETAQQSPWSGVGNYVPLSNPDASNGNQIQQRQGADDWSVCGNKSTLYNGRHGRY